MTNALNDEDIPASVFSDVFASYELCFASYRGHMQLVPYLSVCL